MSTYSPDTVAVATVRGVPNVRVFRSKSGDRSHWFSAETVGGDFWHWDSNVTDVHPLVVLGLPDHCIKQVLGDIRWAHSKTHNARLAYIADQIEAQTRPPKPEEPTGHYAIAIADGVVWCRAAWASDRPWSRVGTDVFADWAELDVTSIEFAGVDQ